MGKKTHAQLGRLTRFVTTQDSVIVDLCRRTDDHATRLEQLEDTVGDSVRLQEIEKRLDALESLDSECTGAHQLRRAGEQVIRGRLDKLEKDNDAHQAWLADLHDTVQSISDLANRVGAIEAGLEAKGRREGRPLTWKCSCDSAGGGPYQYAWHVDDCMTCGAVRPRLAGES